MTKWPLTPLGELLKRADRFESREELAEYRFAGTYSFSRGIFVGEVKPGSTFALPKVQRIHEGDFVYCKIMAWEGAFGLVPKEADECVMSGAFVAYEPNLERISPRFLDFFFKVPHHWKEVGQLSIGTNVRRRSLHPNQFEASAIPLPPLAEQRRIVARIESLVVKIEEAKSLRQQAVQEEERLLICMAHREDLPTNEKLRSGWFETTVGSICRFTDESELVEGSRSYPNLGIFSYGRGVFPKPSIEGVATSAQTLRRVRAGQFIYSRLFAFEGAYAMVPPELDGHYVSGEYPTFTCDPTKACAEFLWAHFRSPNVWQTVAAGSKGLGNRRQRVQPDRVLEYRLWVPPMEWQRKIQSVHSKVDGLKKLQAETTAELAALLPSILDKAFKWEM
jgi:type I restriction enzyme S subunit